MSNVEEYLTEELIDRAVELFAEPGLYEPDQPAKLREFVAGVLQAMVSAIVPDVEQLLAQGDTLVVEDGEEAVVVSVRLEGEEAEELLETAAGDSVNFVKRAIASALATHDGYSARGGEVGVTVTVHPDEALAGKLDLVLESLESLHIRIDKRWRQVMANLEGLEEAVAALGAEEGAAATEMQQLVTEISSLEAGSVTQEQIDAITERATAVANALSSATTAAEDATPAPGAPAGSESVTPPPTPEPTPDPAPAEGGVPAEEQPAPDPTPEPAEPAAPAEPEGGETPAPDAPAEEQPAPAVPDAPAPAAPAEPEGGSPSSPEAPSDWTPDQG